MGDGQCDVAARHTFMSRTASDPKRRTARFPRRVWTRRLALRRSHVIVPSWMLKDMALKVWNLAAGRVHYIPNGIEPRATAIRPRSRNSGSICRPACRASPGRARFGGKRISSRLLRAFAPLKNEAVLLIIGEGPKMERCWRKPNACPLPRHASSRPARGCPRHSHAMRHSGPFERYRTDAAWPCWRPWTPAFPWLRPRWGTSNTWFVKKTSLTLCRDRRRNLGRRCGLWWRTAPYAGPSGSPIKGACVRIMQRRIWLPPIEHFSVNAREGSTKG